MATIASNVPEEALSPKDKGSAEQEIQNPLDSMDISVTPIDAFDARDVESERADPDAQATVTDFLDFTEYLPSDIVRSLTLIGKLDETYNDASIDIHNMTTTWGQLPNLPASDDRPTPVQLRADISAGLTRAVSARSFAHAEAVRMSDNVGRHYTRAKTILSKLQTMLENYPTEEEQQKSPVAVSRVPQLSRKPSARGADGEKVRRPAVPRITVPGEVLAPYDNFETYSSGTETSSSEEEDEIDSIATPAPRIKLVKPPKTPKPPKPPRASTARTPKSTSTPAVPLIPLVEPPPNAVIGSADAPWLQLTPWEMARLRKRMKKNATWTPSDTMISRELNDLGRGIDAYRAAKKKAEEEGRNFEPAAPAIAAESDAPNMKTPEGALSAAAIKSNEVQLSNRGMKLNEAKKLKRESMAKQAAEEAEESARRFNETARRLMVPHQPQQPSPAANKAKPGKANGNGSAPKPATPSNSTNNKRKRDSMNEGDATRDSKDAAPESRPPPVKRNKMETPVPLPQLRASLSAQPLTETPVPPPVITPGGTAVTPQSMTPVPVPVPGTDASKRTVSPALSKESAPSTVTTNVPVKPPAETPIPPPAMSPRKSTTPILPPVREASRRETRGDAAKKVQQEAEQTLQPVVSLPPTGPAARRPSLDQVIKRSSSRSRTRSATPAEVPGKGARPGSRGGKAGSQEPQPPAASDRPRRASTARNTPAPEARKGPVRKRPAPGIVSKTASGGSSAVGRRRKAPSRKRVRTQKKDSDQAVEEFDEEVDDEGIPIDPAEPRYCSCKRVSFGTMISCDNDDCSIEWFHLECVGLTAIPARTTKWYCPDCRKTLNIGEKGEVNARGVKM